MVKPAKTENVCFLSASGATLFFIMFVLESAKISSVPPWRGPKIYPGWIDQTSLAKVSKKFSNKSVGCLGPLRIGF